MKNRKPIHPGIILEEDYIKPLEINNLQELADQLGISRKTLHKLRTASTKVTPILALKLSRLFNTSPEFWLNLQQKYDLWVTLKENPDIDDIRSIA